MATVYRPRQPVGAPAGAGGQFRPTARRAPDVGLAAQITAEVLRTRLTRHFEESTVRQVLLELEHQPAERLSTREAALVCANVSWRARCTGRRAAQSGKCRFCSKPGSDPCQRCADLRAGVPDDMMSAAQARLMLSHRFAPDVLDLSFRGSPSLLSAADYRDGILMAHWLSSGTAKDEVVALRRALPLHHKATSTPVFRLHQVRRGRGSHHVGSGLWAKRCGTCGRLLIDQSASYTPAFDNHNRSEHGILPPALLPRPRTAG